MKHKKRVTKHKINPRKVNSTAVNKKHQVFWATLGILFLLTFISVIFFSPGPLVTGNAAIQTVAFMKAGTDLHFEVKVDGLKEMTVTFSEDVKNIVITTEEVSNVNWPFAGKIYSMFKVSSVDEDKISQAKLVLKLKETDLQNRGLSKEAVTLYYQGQPLKTTLINEEEGYVTYYATCSGIGEFLIGKEVTSANAVEETPVVTTTAVVEPSSETGQLPLTGKASGEKGSSLWETISGWFN